MQLLFVHKGLFLCIFGALLSSHFAIIVDALQCYKHACWGEDCSSFDIDPRGLHVDRCPSDAQGCLHSFGTTFLEKHHETILINQLYPSTTPSPSIWDWLSRRRNIIRRETRSCWVPHHGMEGSRGGIGSCTPTRMYHWFPNLAQMLQVSSTECLCAGNLCNGQVIRGLEYGYHQGISGGRIASSGNLTLAFLFSVIAIVTFIG